MLKIKRGRFFGFLAICYRYLDNLPPENAQISLWWQKFRGPPYESLRNLIFLNITPNSACFLGLLLSVRNKIEHSLFNTMPLVLNEEGQKKLPGSRVLPTSFLKENPYYH